MEVYLIRHTTPLIDKGLIYGRLDVPVCEERFETEKESILRQLHVVPDKVYSSPSIRCKRLAELIAKDVQIDERLSEYNFGDWEGKNWNTIDNDETKAWMEDFINVRSPNGETIIEMQNRVLSFWSDLSNIESSVAKIVVITHGGVNRIIKGMIDQIPLKDLFSIKVGYGEIVRILI